MSFLWHQTRLAGHAKRLNIDILHSPTYRRILWRSPVKQVATIHDCAPFVLRDKYGFFERFVREKNRSGDGSSLPACDCGEPPDCRRS